MNITPEIIPIKPKRSGEPPEGFVLMPIPFVGVYCSLLGADIDSELDEMITYCEDQAKEIRIEFDEIYKSIALYTADLLGITGAIYAGTSCPKYYNNSDDQPYLFVPKKYYDWAFGEVPEFSYSDKRIRILCDKLMKVVDPWYLDEYHYCVTDAVYAQWVHRERGNEIIYHALKFVE